MAGELLVLPAVPWLAWSNCCMQVPNELNVKNLQVVGRCCSM
jgi:hypothetical protein